MDPEKLETVVLVASLLIAAGSLSFNVYQHSKRLEQENVTRTTVAPAIRREDVRNSILSIIQKIDSSEIFTVQPHYEIWPYGFKSLEEARSIFATANLVISSSSVPPADIKLIVAELLGKVRFVLKFRDSLTRITGERSYATPTDLDKWPQKQDAEAALHDLQMFVRSREAKLRDYLNGLSI